MDFICQHRDKLKHGLAYRVTSEEAGVILLEMIVCQSCSEQAKNLRLDVKEINQAVWERSVCVSPNVDDKPHG
jgi:hypothetical protein